MKTENPVWNARFLSHRSGSNPFGRSCVPRHWSWQGGRVLVLTIEANGRPGVEEVVQSAVVQFSLVASFLLDLPVTEATCENVISTTEDLFPKSRLTTADNATGPDYKCFNAPVQGQWSNECERPSPYFWPRVETNAARNDNELHRQNSRQLNQVRSCRETHRLDDLMWTLIRFM
jgi:hypothetical protein